MSETQQQTLESKVQSRVGKRPVEIVDGVDVELKGSDIFIKGPKGELHRRVPDGVNVEIRDNAVMVTPAARTAREGKRLQGLVRALIAGMIEGVSKGYHQSMDLYGVGYRAEQKGNELNLLLGFSHSVQYQIPDGIQIEIKIIDEGGVKRPRLLIDSHNKELLGQTIAQIRSLKPPEPYKGKGFRVQGERIREKAGKAGSKSS